MYRYRRPKKKNFLPRVASVAVTAAAFAAAAWYAPTRAADADVREFSEGLRIKINRGSPAFAALEDTISSFESEMDLVSPYVPMQIIAADETSFAPHARAIVAQNRELQASNVSQLRWAQAAAQTTTAAKQSQATLNIATLKAPQAAAATAPPLAPASEPFNNEGFGAIVADPGSVLITGGKIISLNDREKIDALQAAAAPTEHPTKTISLAELGIDKAELLRGLFFPIVTSEQQAAKAAAAKPTMAADRVAGLGLRTRPKSVANERGTNSSGLNTQALTDGVAAADVEPMGQLVVSGPVEMAGGLAITSSSDQIVIYREEQGERFESGYVWLRDGRYEIYLESVSGQLVGELQTANGDVLGRGEIDLSRLQAGRPQYRAAGVKIAIRPLAKGLSGQVISAYSHGTKVMAIAKANVDLEEINQSLTTETNGKFSYPELGTGSVVITKITKAGHWGTLAFVEAGADNIVTMFPDSMISAFRSLAGASGRQPVAVVWGRVTKNGQPIAGAAVEMITGEKEVKPVYFNALLIPDPSLQATSANGAYAFVVSETGIHGVQVRSEQGALDPVLFPVEAGFVTSIDLEADRTKKLDIKVFDAFQTSNALAAKVTPVGSEASLTVGADGRGILRYSPSSGLVAADVDAGESYAVTRLNLPRERGLILAPMFEGAWLEEMRANRRISKEPGTGVIVGFVQARTTYEVHIRPEGAALAAKVIYFDAQGKPLRTRSGVPGGGYAIFGVPEGLATVSVVSGGSTKIQSVTALADTTAVNVFNHSLR